jgi:hypothetical protein
LKKEDDLIGKEILGQFISAQFDSTSRLGDPGTTARSFTVFYAIDGTSEDLEIDELRPLLKIDNNANRTDAINDVLPAFKYLEERITGSCNNNMSFVKSYSMYKALRLFHPSRAVELNYTPAHLDILLADVPAMSQGDSSGAAALLCCCCCCTAVCSVPNGVAVVAGCAVDITEMKLKFPVYMQLASTFDTDTNDITAMTNDILSFWRRHHEELGPAWTNAARIVFSISPNSAASERVFSLMKRFYGHRTGRDRALADQISASLKLAYNHRVGEN